MAKLSTPSPSGSDFPEKPSLGDEPATEPRSHGDSGTRAVREVKPGPSRILPRPFRLDSSRAGVILVALAFLCPGVITPLLLAILAAQLVLTLAPLWTSMVGAIRANPSPRPREGRAPRFSVHIATHNEPPALVIATLDSLTRQVAPPPFEVIVLDNNTLDPEVWQPVRDWCRGRGPRFRFLHREGVLGAKAGALNIALAESMSTATHIVVVDADYQMTPDFLANAAEALRQGDVDFVQFPQAYRSGEAAAGVVLELSDYFTRHARVADAADAMLLTGTLSVIDRRALAAAGGWSSATLTEDAELGVRLRALGYHGRLDGRLGGRGLLPLDFAALEQQRYRWAAGNLASLGGMTRLPVRTAAHVFAQLTAWTNLALPAAACLAGGWLRLAQPGLILEEEVAARLVIGLASLCLSLVVLGAVAPLIATLPRARARTVAAATAARIALLPAAARGTIDGLLGTAGGFRRTPKSSDGARSAVPLPLIALACLGIAMLILPAPAPLARLGALLMFLPAGGALLTARHLTDYRAALAA
jgi:hypothetical protein